MGQLHLQRVSEYTRIYVQHRKRLVFYGSRLISQIAGFVSTRDMRSMTKRVLTEN